MPLKITIVPAASPVGSDTSWRMIGIDHSVCARPTPIIFLSRSDSLVPLASCANSCRRIAPAFARIPPAAPRPSTTAAQIAVNRTFIVRPAIPTLQAT